MAAQTYRVPTRVSAMKSQAGFTIGSVVMVVLLIGAIAITAHFVSRANKDNQKQATILEEAFKGDTSGDNAVDDGYIPPSPETDSKEYPIKRVNVEIQALDVSLIATLPGVYTGNCFASVSLPDGSESRRFIQEVDTDDTCRITIPRTKLTAGKTWKFQMSFQSSDGKTHGDHPESQFSL